MSDLPPDATPAPSSGASSNPSAPGKRPPRRGRWKRWLLGLGAALALVLLLAAAGLWWVLRQESGTAFVLERLPGVTVVRPKGSFLGDFGADELRVRFGDGGELRLVQVAWTQLSVRGGAGGPAWARVVFDRLSAEQAWLTLPKPQQTTRTPPPTELPLPVELIVRSFRIGTLHAAPLGDEPLKELRAQVHLGADQGRQHRIDALSVARGPLQARGHAHVGATAPMTSDIQLQLQQAAVAQWPAWGADLRLAGPLAESRLTGRLLAKTQPAQSLSIESVVRPFAEWPLARLDAQAQDLNVAALLSSGPDTALSGRIVLAEANPEQPLQAQVDLSNAAAGSWDAGRVPVRQVVLTLQVDPRDRNQLQLPRFELSLGSAEAAAGTVRGSGRWTPTGWTVQAGLEDVRPERLDARAVPMRVSGRLQANGVGFGGGGVGPPPTERVVDLSGTLSGHWPDRPRSPPLALDLAGRFSMHDNGRQQLLVRDLRAAAGPSRAELTGSAERSAASAPWLLKGRLGLKDVDLQAWLPASPDAALRQGPSRVTGQGDWQLTLPSAGPAGDTFAWLSTLQGRAQLRLAPSVLAGLPLSGQATLEGRGGAEGLQVALAAEAAGNSVRAQGRIAGESARDRWQATIDAPALQRLAPLLRSLQPGPGSSTATTTPAARAGGRDAAPAFAGSVQGELLAEGRWPRITTRGRLTATQLVWPGVRLDQAQARWQAGTQRGAPVEADMSLTNLTLTGSQQARQVPRLRLTMDGRADQHRLALDAELAAAPPARSDPVRTRAPQPGPAAGPRTLARVRAAGGLLYREAAAGEPAGLAIAGWRGRIDEADARAPGASEPLLRTVGVSLEALAARPDAPPRVQVQPGRVAVMGGALQWSRLRWQGAQGTAAAVIDADVVLEPLQVVPLLQRLQPDAGITGDLVIDGRVVIRSAPVLRLEAQLQRRSGDLTMTTASRTLRLGLQQLRAGVRADGARWVAEADVEAASIGSARAAVNARTAGPQAWPDANTAMQGTLRLQVADLGVYEPWLPVGWRLDGRVQADARLGGTLSAPQWQGAVRGDQLAVSNVIEGVRVRDGELRAVLEGDRARIERFVARGGDGTVRIEGGARLGTEPTAELNLTAQDFRALARVDRRIDVNGQAQLRMDARRLALRGRFEVDEGLIDLGRSEAPQLSEDVVVVDDEAARARAARPAPKAPARAIDLDVRVDLGNALQVRGRGVNTRIAGQLQVTAPGGQLAVNGTVRTVDGTYEAYGTKLAIERGIVTIAGSPTNPRLDVLAMRTDLEEVRVGVSITGTAQNPRVQLTSTPSLSEMDKLSYLTMGRPSASLAGDQTAVLQRAAMALWQGDRGGGGGGIAQRVGLDKLAVRRGESGGVNDAVVSLGKQVSDRLYVGYQQSLDAAGGSWELIYKIAQRFTLRVQTGDTTALDAIWTWLWG